MKRECNMQSSDHRSQSVNSKIGHRPETEPRKKSKLQLSFLLLIPAQALKGLKVNRSSNTYLIKAASIRFAALS